MKKVYLASPFFNETEIERVDKVKEILDKAGLEVFSPKDHQHPEYEFGSKEWREVTFKNDIAHIDWCDVVVAIISQGNYDDSGSSFELGYAFGTGKKAIVVNLTGKTINLMIADSLHAIVTSYEELANYDFENMPRIAYENYVW